MRLKIHLNINSIISFFTILLVCSFVIFESYSWGRFVVLACVAAILICSVFREDLKFRFVFGQYLITVLLFMLYTLMSALWAINSSDAVAKGKTLLEISLMIFVLYNSFYKNEDSVSDILSIIKWSSYVIAIYSLLFYGIDELLMMSVAEQRLENAYTNVNTIGMVTAMGIIIQIDEIIREKKFKFAVLFCIPSLFMLTVTQSRKAFVALLAGVFMSILFRNVHSKDIRKNLFRIIISIVAIILLLYIVSSLPLFSGVLSRMDDLIDGFTGTGAADASSTTRSRMVEVGLEQFLKTPLFGVGIGNTHYVAMEMIGMDTYLHNNFVELLAGGGIIGFLIYYSMYMYLFAIFWKHRKNKNKEYVLCLIMMLLLFVMDYGMVSYSSKLRYIYLLLFFLEADVLKRLPRTINHEDGA